MKLDWRRTLALVLVLGLSIAGSVSAAHHLNGSWNVTVTLGDGQGGSATLALEEQEGGKLTGTYTGALGEEEVEGTVDGAEVVVSFDSQAGKVTYKGTFADGKITGTCTYGQLGEGTFEAVKKDG